MTRDLVARILAEETARLRSEVSEELFTNFYAPASELVAEICLSEEYTDFLTQPAYELLVKTAQVATPTS